MEMQAWEHSLGDTEVWPQEILLIDPGDSNFVIKPPQETALFSVPNMSGLEQIVAFPYIYPRNLVFPLEKFNVFSMISSFYKYLFSFCFLEFYSEDMSR